MIFIHFGKNLLSNFFIGFPILILIFLFPIYIFRYFYFDSYIYLFILLVLEIFIFNFIFKLTYFYIKKKKFNIPKQVNFEDLHIEPHPYLPFIYKENFQIRNETILYSEINNEKFKTPKLKTNNYRFINGVNGDRNIQIPKPKELFRINCLGASTTGNYLMRNNENFSYPLRLEKLLKDNLGSNYEVNNCGQGGYTSIEILIRFCIQIIDTSPDLIILYHGYNDIRSYLTDNYKSDYSNSKKNLSNEYWKIKIYLKIFKYIKISFLYFLLNKWFNFNIKNSLLDIVSIKKINKNLDYKDGLITFKRNIENLILLCKAKNIDIILSTFCYYLHENIANDSLSKKYDFILSEENKIIEELSNKYNITLVDNNKIIEKNSNNFLDSIHFTPEGMEKIAFNFYEIIRDKYKNESN